MDVIKQLENECAKAGVLLEQKASGHYHIKGALLVNYYPLSKNRSAYVAGTMRKLNRIDPATAVQMSLAAPTSAPVKSKRKVYTKVKLRMLAKTNKCKWCDCELTAESATVDHVIPLSRGGLDNANNRVLACSPCNQKRGNTMPEVKEKAKTILNEARTRI
jgi:transcription elongation factor Elf1